MADLLVYDVLERIFAYLDTKDLIACENVCCQWKYVIESGPTWRKLLGQKVKHSQFWRNSWNFRSSPSKTGEIREFCLSVTEKLERVERNKRNGSFRILARKYVASEVQERVFYMNEDYVLFQPKYPSPSFRLLNRHTAELKNIDLNLPGLCCSVIKGDLLVCGGEGMFQIFNVNTMNQVKQVIDPNGWKVKCVAFGRRGLLLTGSCSTEECQLTAWRMKSPVDIVYLQHWRFDAHNIKLKIDDQFFAVLTTKYLMNFPASRYQVSFISTSTHEVERSFCTCSDVLEYKQGLVSLLSEDRVVRVLDVKTGKILSPLHLGIGVKTCFLMKFWTNLLVTVQFEGASSLFHFYEMRATMEAELVKSFRLNGIKVNDLQLNETLLSCVCKETETGHDAIVTLDFE